MGVEGPRPLLSFCGWGFCCGGGTSEQWEGLPNAVAPGGFGEDPLFWARVGRGLAAGVALALRAELLICRPRCRGKLSGQ